MKSTRQYLPDSIYRVDQYYNHPTSLQVCLLLLPDTYTWTRYVKIFCKNGGSMTNNESEQVPGGSEILAKLNALEKRIDVLENEVRNPRRSKSGVKQEIEENEEDYRLTLKLPWQDSEEEGIESKIGEYGLAWLGNIVLIFGIVFLSQYLTNTGHLLIAGIIGYIAVAGILTLAHFIRKSYSYMAYVFTLFGHVLLFYTTLRLFFFTDPPVVSSKSIIVTLLLCISGYQFFEAIRRKSQGFAIMAFLLSLVLSVVSDNTHIMLPIVTILAGISVFFFYRFGWSRLLILSVILNYLVFLMWLVSNPLMGHTLQAVTHHQYAFFYLAATGAIYSMITLIRQKGLFPDGIILTTVILYGLGFSVILGLMVVTFFPDNYMWIFTTIAIFCLLFSALLKYRSPWKYSPALYALYGFLAVSITFYGIWKFPDAFLALSIQSFLVVSMALWFRSRIIVVMNLFLFLGLLIGYAGTSANLMAVNFSFPVVAFLSARIINWQKERLNIKTELIRNTYLIVLFLTMLFAFYNAVPKQYVTLSWTCVALLYFLLSIFMKNVKYRYLAIATMLATAFYLFAVDLARIGMVYRIVAFLFLAIISIGISTFYVRKIKKKQAESKAGGD